MFATFDEEIKLLIAKAILQGYVAPIPMSYDDIWKQSNEASKALSLRQAERVLEVLGHRNLAIAARPADNASANRQATLSFFAAEDLLGIEKENGETRTILKMTPIISIVIRRPLPRVGDLKSMNALAKITVRSDMTGSRIEAECYLEHILVSANGGALMPLNAYLQNLNNTNG